MKRSPDDRSREIQSLILEFLEQHPEPTREHEESLCSQHPDLAPLLRELLPRVRDVEQSELRARIERLVTDATQVVDRTRMEGERPPPPPAKPWSPAADTVTDRTVPATPPKPLFDGRYRVIKTLGQGGFGRVDLVEDTLRHDEKVALKVILARHADTKEFELRFQNEISVLRTLRHEGIPQIFNDGRTSDGEFYYTMEYVDGASLEEVLDREKRLGPLRIVRLVRQITNVLEYAHSQGVVHRDLKPGNVILVNEGTDDEKAKVLDFGIAKILRKEGMLEYAETMNTMAGMGTPHYMSPEQVRGKEVDGRTDFYALGVMIYRMVSSRFPFKGKTPMEIATTRLEHDPIPLEVDEKSTTELTTQLATLVKSLLEREKEKRPDAEGIRRLLVLEGMAKERRRFHRFGRRVLLAAAAAVVLIVAYFAWKSSPDREVVAGGGGERTEKKRELPPGPGPSALLTRVDGQVPRPFRLTGRAANLERVRVEWDQGASELDVGPDGSFSGDLDLADGEHHLRVVAPDSGKELDSTDVLVDGTPPVITLDELPGTLVEEDGTPLRYVHETPVVIRGSVRDAAPGILAGLSTGTREITPAPDGSFSYSLFERVGAGDERETVVLVARDEANNLTETRVVFVYDGSPPSIRFDRDGDVWTGDRTLETAEDGVRLTVENVDTHALQLFQDGRELSTTGGKASVDLELDGAPERAFRFKATDLSGRESTAEIELSRALALVALTVAGDEDALHETSITTPLESIVVAGRLNRPAQEVEVSVGRGERVAAKLADSGEGFETEVALEEGESEELVIFLDGRRAGSWNVTWQPPRAPAGLVRIGTEGVDGLARYVRHEATGMQFVLVTPPERPYVYGDVQIDVDRPYYIGTTEVTWSQFTASGLDYEDQRFWEKITDRGNYPMVGVAFQTAVAYCDWLRIGNGAARLPTEAEWLHAAGGPDAPAYPWGEAWDASRCQSRDSDARNPVAVTVHADAASWCGAWGFAGNVSEWCTRADGSPVLRGGSWASGSEECRLTERPVFRGEGGKNTVGFRVVIVPE